MINLLIRADANSTIGTGHVMRCLALAHIWHDYGGNITMLAHESLPASLKNRLAEEHVNVLTHSNEIGSMSDAQHAVALAQQQNTILILDGYKFDAHYQKIIKSNGVTQLLIDDYGHSDFYYADYVLNQNSYANEAAYVKRDPEAKLLLGSQYALLRREFWKWRGWQRLIPATAQKLLVTLGGSDPANVTLIVLQAIQQLTVPLEVTVIVGGSNPHFDALKAYVEQHNFHVTLLQNVTDMPDRMADADIAIAAGGSTNWELCMLGLPTAIIVIADNQRPIGVDLQERGAAINLGWFETLTPQRILSNVERLVYDSTLRSRMSQQGQTLVDGYGADRVMQAVTQPTIILRPARPDDCRLVWEWANDPNVRAVSFSSEPISWEDHVQWYKHKLQQSNCSFYIAENPEKNPIGQVRFETDHEEAVISVSLDKRCRGRGYGSRLISEGARMIFDQSHIQQIRAYIKPDNFASLNAFKKAGFELKDNVIYANHPAVHMVLTREIP